MTPDQKARLEAMSAAELDDLSSKLTARAQAEQDPARLQAIQGLQTYLGELKVVKARRAKLSTEMTHGPSWPTLESLTGESEGRSAMRSMGQGLFNLGDEAAGALGAIPGALATGDSVGEAYTDIRDAEREALQVQHEAADTQAEMSGGRVAGSERFLVPEVAGGLVSGAATARAAAALPKLAAVEKTAPWARAAAAGTGGGAATGFGAGEGDAMDQLYSTGVGAVSGAVGGSIAAFLGAAGTKGLQMLSRLAMPATTSTDEQARRVIMAQLESAGVTPEEVADWVRQQGPDVVPAQHPALQGLVRGTLSGNEQQLVGDLVENHVERQYTDLMKAVEDLFTGTAEGKTMGVNFADVRERVADVIRRRAAPEYDKLYANPPPQSDRLRELLDNAKLKQAYADAIDVETIDPSYGASVSLRLKPGAAPSDKDPWEWETTPTWRELDLVQRGLRAQVEKAKRAAATGQGGSSPFESENWGKLRGALVEELDSINPAFGELRRQYASDISVRDHIDMGQKVFYRGGPNWDADDIAYHFKRMNPDEQQAYRIGVLKALRENLAARGDNQNLSYASVFNTPDGRARLESVFGPETLKSVLGEVKRLGRNAATARRLNTITSTSDTLNQRDTFGMTLTGIVNEGLKDANPINNPSVLNNLTGSLLKQHDPAAFLQAVQSPSVMGDWMPRVQQALGMPTAGPSGLWGGIGGTGAAQVAAPLFQQPQE